MICPSHCVHVENKDIRVRNPLLLVLTSPYQELVSNDGASHVHAKQSWWSCLPCACYYVEDIDVVGKRLPLNAPTIYDDQCAIVVYYTVSIEC